MLTCSSFSSFWRQCWIDYNDPTLTNGNPCRTSASSILSFQKWSGVFDLQLSDDYCVICTVAFGQCRFWPPGWVQLLSFHLLCDFSLLLDRDLAAIIALRQWSGLPCHLCYFMGIRLEMCVACHANFFCFLCVGSACNACGRMFEVYSHLSNGCLASVELMSSLVVHSCSQWSDVLFFSYACRLKDICSRRTPNEALRIRQSIWTQVPIRLLGQFKLSGGSFKWFGF